MKLGYPCINQTLSPKVLCSRTARLATLNKNGIGHLEELILKNLDDLYTILQWNREHSIFFFRISSGLFPLTNKYTIDDLSSSGIIKNKLKIIGTFIQQHGMRVSFHADPYSVLSSSNPRVVDNAIRDLNFLSNIFDLMGLSATPYYKINVHVGSYKPDKSECAKRFVDNYFKLAVNTQYRLTVENDDKPGSFTPSDLYYMVYVHTGVPIVFDYLHYRLNHEEGNSEKASLEAALCTWKCTPVVHYSSSRRLEDKSARELAHADYIYEKIETYDGNFDIMLESKAKEGALLKYLKDF
jgi:UV DNA damage endonuclease